MKTPEERGPVGAWAYTARTDADVSVEQVVSRLELRGISVSAATLRGIEGGSKKPGRMLLRALSEVYGQHPPSLNGARVAGDYAELVAAQDRTTKAIERNTRVLAALLESLVRAQGIEWTPEEEAALAEAKVEMGRLPLPQSPVREGQLGEP